MRAIDSIGNTEDRKAIQLIERYKAILAEAGREYEASDEETATQIPESNLWIAVFLLDRFGDEDYEITPHISRMAYQYLKPLARIDYVTARLIEIFEGVSYGTYVPFPKAKCETA